MRGALVPMLALVLGLAPRPAAAHANYPETLDVLFSPASQAEFFVSLSFGLLVSRDEGATWRWICESAIGYGGSYQPDYAVTQTGTLFASTFVGLRSTRDGCTWSSTTLDTAFVATLTVATDGALYVALGSADDRRILRSRDDGKSFVPTGVIPSDGSATWRSLEAAPGQPRWLTLTGTRRDSDGVQHVLLYRSRDAGETWDALPVSDFDLPVEAVLTVAAVSPDDGDLLFARVSPRRTLDGDALYRSVDGGKMWRKVFDTVGAIPAVVVRRMLTADIPRDAAEVVVGTKVSGTFVSKQGGTTFQAMGSSLQTECMKERGDGELFVCASQFDPDRLALGRSATGDQWRPVLDLKAIVGPVDCPEGTQQRDECETNQWCGVQLQLGIAADEASCRHRDDDGAGPPPDASGPGAEVDAGSPGRDRSGGGCSASLARPTSWLALALFGLVWQLGRHARTRGHREGRHTSLLALARLISGR